MNDHIKWLPLLKATLIYINSKNIFSTFLLFLVRLIVDTGVHGFGWSRAKARAYILDNTPCSEESATEQVSPFILEIKAYVKVIQYI
jgi:hypothetical protein